MGPVILWQLMNGVRCSAGDLMYTGSWVKQSCYYGVMYSDVFYCRPTVFLKLMKWYLIFGIGNNVRCFISGTGLGENNDMQLNPKMIKTLATSHVIQITCGYDHSLALTKGVFYEFFLKEL